jgi:hypothetical protein
VNHFERQVERLDALLVEAAPGHRAAEIAALRRRLGVENASAQASSFSASQLGRPGHFSFM